MHRIARINGSLPWQNLTNKLVKNKCIEITNCGDIDRFRQGPVFHETETVFINHCNKNFVYYWLDKQTFPNVKKIYLSSHPCEYPVLRRFPESQIYLAHWFKNYRTRWADDLSNVIVIRGSQIEALLTQMSDEELVTESQDAVLSTQITKIK